MAETQAQSVFQPNFPKSLLTEDEIEILSTFNIEVEDLADGMCRLYATDWCTEGTNPALEELDEDYLFEMLQSIIRRSEGKLTWISKETCYFSEQAVPGEDEVGGSAIFITADEVRVMGTGGWLEEQEVVQKRNPSLLELLELGCTVTFPTASRIYLIGDPASKYIDIGTESGRDGVWPLSPEGLVNALKDADKMADQE